VICAAHISGISFVPQEKGFWFPISGIQDDRAWDLAMPTFVCNQFRLMLLNNGLDSYQAEISTRCTNLPQAKENWFLVPKMEQECQNGIVSLRRGSQGAQL
jgi:hypothetical protein